MDQEKDEKINIPSPLTSEKEASGGLVKFLIIVVVLLTCVGILISFSRADFSWEGMVNSVERKLVNVTSKTISSIQIEPGEDAIFVPYKSGLLCIGANGIRFFNMQSKEEWNEQRTFSTPIVSVCGKYLLIADTTAQSVYVYNGSNMIWNKSIQGEILAASINEFGSVGVISKGDKSRLVVQVFDNIGNEQMIRYYSSNYAVDVKISPDNKYAAIGEMDVAGMKTSAGVGIVPMGTELYSSSFEEDSIFGSMGYLDKELIVILNKKILDVKPDGTKSLIRDLPSDMVTNISISSKKYIVIVEKANRFLSDENNITIVNKNGKEIGTYKVSGRVVSVDSSKDVIAVNLASKVIFLNASGREISQFNPKKEVREVKLFQDGAHAAIVYADHVDIVNVY